MDILHVQDNLYRGPRPQKFTDFYTLRTMGIKQIVNLEGGIIEGLTADQNGELALGLLSGMDVFHVEMNSIFPPSRFDVDLAHHLINQSTVPTYVHCRWGKDRTGFVIAAFRMKYCNWSYETAKNEMYANGFHKFYIYWLPALKKWA